MNYIFYDYKKVIVGLSEIMYHGKWYLCLYACESYVIIYYRNNYVKLDKYEVEDCEYNITVYDDDGSCRVANNSELMQMIEDGKYALMDYDMDAVEACKSDMELIRTNDLKLYFLSGTLTKVTNNSDNEELQTKFHNIVTRVSELPMGEDRRGLNIIFIDNLKPNSLKLINIVLRKYRINTDNEAIRCLDYRFIMDLVAILEGEQR